MTDRPAELIWCVVCDSARPFTNEQVEERSRRHEHGYNGDRLVCRACKSTLVSVYARIEVPALAPPS